MEWVILGRPDAAMLLARLAPGEGLRAEAGALAGKDAAIMLETSVQGGIMAGLKRLVGGEMLFVHTYRAVDRPGEALFAPRAPGDMARFRMRPGEDLILQAGAFVACALGVELDLGGAGASGSLAGRGLAMTRASGEGELFVGGCGTIVPVAADGGLSVDAGAVLAYSAGLECATRPVDGFNMDTPALGEGVACVFAGVGTVYVQTRRPAALAAFMHAFRPASPGKRDSPTRG